MEIKYIQSNGKTKIAELIDKDFLIKQPQDALDIFGNLIAEDCYSIIIHEKNLHSDFFDLKTRLAGEVLQKFSNYHVKVAIVGDFTKFNSKSLQDFIYESNKSNRVFFLDTVESAFEKFGKYK